MLDYMPDFEISRIDIKKGNNDLINTLAEKLNYQSKQDLYNALYISACDYSDQSEPFEYLSEVYYPGIHDMS